MIKNCRLSLLIVALSLLGAMYLHAAPALPGVSPEDAKQILPVSQVKRGMRGYGLTVFHGTKIEKFDFEVLGVLKKMNTGKDLILVRVGGGPITARQTGIIAGMSGSPCYVNDKLIGAIAWGRTFTKEPVGMITPIADMLEAWDENLPKNASGYSSPQPLSEPVTIGGKTVRKVAIDENGSSPKAVDDGVLYMRPLMTPMAVGGVSERGMERLADILRPFHIQPVAGMSGGEKPGVKADLAPGAAVGMSLASGDIDMTGIGTVTYRRGNKLVAFGHPMLGIGAVDAPMTTAYIDDLISGYQESSKLGSPIKTVGRIFQDRPWSIAGTVGNMPKTIPVTVEINDQASKRNRTYHVNIINHPLLASRLATMIVGEAISQTHPTPGDATAEVSYEVNADQVGKIKRSNVFFDQTSIDAASMADVGSLLQILSSNRFYPLDIKSVNVKVKIVDKRNTAQIDRIFIKKSEYEPGETVDVGVVLRPYKKERITKTFSIKIPATTPDGKVILQVRGGGTPNAIPMVGPGGPQMVDEEDGPMGPIGGDSGIASADNIKQLVDKYLERERNNQVVVQLLMRSTAINVAGEKLSGLPNSIADVMKSSRNSGLKMERDEVKQLFTDDAIIVGVARLPIDIKHKSLKEVAASAGPGGPPTDAGADSPHPGGSDDYSPASYEPDEPMMAPMASGTSVDVTEEPAQDDQPPAPAPAKEEPAKDKDKNAKTPAPVAAAPAAQPPAPKSDVKSIVRQVTNWSQRTQADFAKGTFSGVSASSENRLELAPTLKKVAETPEQFVWCVAPAKDGVYAGTGNSGKIFHVTDGGQISPFFETGELEVQSLARDSKGNVYAGTSPHGKIFKITPDGKGQMIFKADEKYVVALAVDGQNDVYAGVGDAGKVYRISPDGTGKLFTTVNEQQVLSLSWDVHGSLIVGTGINGVVYRVSKDGTAAPIFDAAENAISSVVSDGDGNVYAGTSPKGIVYKITPDGRSKPVFTKASRVLSMTSDQRNNIYAVSDGTLVRIAPDETVIQLDSSRDKVQYLSLVFNELTGALYAGTGNIGSVYTSKCCDIIGTYESPIHDAKMISKWGRVRWTAQTPEGTMVQLQTRTGNVDTPDSTWSDWSRPYTIATGEQVLQKDSRYIQYRITLKTDKAYESPEVSSVTMSYLTPNQQPDVKLSAPAGGAVWSGKQTIKWIGSDPDKDTLTYDVFYSENGKEWHTLIGGMGSGDAPKADEKKMTGKEIAAKVKAELDKSPDVPADMKKQALKDVDAAAKPTPAPETNGGSTPSSSMTSYSWDTTKVEDGNYLVKVVASDKTSNATGALTDEVISEPLIVCNTPPKVELLSKKSVEIKGVGAATIKGTATSKLIEISGVQYRVDGGAWVAAAADDGIFDSPEEAFTFTTTSLTVGTHKVEVQAVDTAGNAASQTVEVKVS
ncbi:MAG: hypothetical protein M1133_06725 [Armatimonadetes bacterium]|nr:hypothetical protein [Armatimonadota bacterium]